MQKYLSLGNLRSRAAYTNFFTILCSLHSRAANNLVNTVERVDVCAYFIYTGVLGIPYFLGCFGYTVFFGP